MKKFTILFLFITVISILHSQSLYNGINYTGCENELSKDILLLRDSSYLIAAQTKSINSPGLMIYKIAADGKVKWSRKHRGFNDSTKTINELEAKYSGNSSQADYLLGVGHWNGNIVTGAPSKGLMILKLEESGGLLNMWSYDDFSGDNFTGTGIESNFHLGNHNFVVSGYSQSGSGIILCVNADSGTIVWQKVISKNGYNIRFYDIKEIYPGRYAVCGFAEKDSLEKGAIIEVDKNGNFLSPLKIFKHPQYSYMNLVFNIILKDTNISSTKYVIGGSIYYYLSNCTDSYIMGVDTGINAGWATVYNYSCREILTDLFYNNNKSISACGFIDDTFYLGSQYPYFMYNIDSNGGPINYLKLGFTNLGHEFSTAVTKNSSGDSLIYAMTTTENGFVQCITQQSVVVKSILPDTNLSSCEIYGVPIFCPNYSALDSNINFTITNNLTKGDLISTDTLISLTVDSACKNTSLYVYSPKQNILKFDIVPNPASDIFTIVPENYFGNYNINIYNSLGGQVYHTESNSGKLNINFISYPKGIYYITLAGNIFLVNKKIIIY